MASLASMSCSSSSQLSPTMTIQEKGSRNKRKFRTDPPISDSDKVIPEPHECTSYEISAEKFDVVGSHGHSNGCDMCDAKEAMTEALKLDLGLSCPVGPSNIGPLVQREEIEAIDPFHDADWSDLTESELEELVLSTLDTVFKSAIKKIVAYGYTKEVATKAILRSGLCYGCKDTVSNIVDNTLAFLSSGQDIDTLREPYFEDLQQMEKYILAELVCVLKELRPFFSTGDAMWCLLICDMNISHACAMETEHMGSFSGVGVQYGTSSPSVTNPQPTESKTAEPKILKPSKPIPSSSTSHNFLPEATNLTSTPNKSFQFEAPTSLAVPKFRTSGCPEKEGGKSNMPNAVDKFLSLAGGAHLPVSEEKFVSTRKLSGITKREYILRQKSLHSEKHRRPGSKGGSRSGKLNNFGGLVLDKKLKSLADSSGVNTRNSFKISRSIGVEVPQSHMNQKNATSIGFPEVPSFPLEPESANSKSYSISSEHTTNTLPVLPVADTELSLSFPAKSCHDEMPQSRNAEAPGFNNNVIPTDKSLSQWIPYDKKDEMVVQLVPRVRELQNQLQEWTEWANQKVMQAARRLGKDNAELKALRQEREEVERLKKEKQVLEESTMKKLSEMENALGKASGQVDRAHAAVRRLEVENVVLGREMEAAKLRAAESAASLQEASMREKSTMLNCQSWEKQKSAYQEELAAEKRNLVELQKKLQQAEDVRNQLEGRWRQENLSKEELLAQANTLKKEKEQLEISTKSKEDAMKLEAENSLHKYKYEIQKLETEISLLKLKTGTSKVAAALKRGIEGSYASKVRDPRKVPISDDRKTLCISKPMTEFEVYSGNDGGVKRERECVMCLSEEMSVVFLPCAHQVVCTTCNELHEKQGMKDCPSCRSIIQQRICVRYANS